MLRYQTYFLVLVNYIIKDYSPNYQTAIDLAKVYKKVLSSTSTVEILEVKSVKIFDVV